MIFRSTAAACGAVLLTFPAAVGAQALEKVPTPIEVHVSAPSSTGTPGTDQPTLLVLPRTRVTIAGTSVPMGSAVTVHVTISRPSGAPAALSAPLDADNAWTTTFSAAEAPGTYAVTASSPDGKNSASATFAVATSATVSGAAEAVTSAIAAGATEVSSGVQAGMQSVANRGEFPNRDQVLHDIEQVGANATELPARLSAFTAAAQTMSQIADQYPAGASELEPITTAMRETAGALQKQ